MVWKNIIVLFLICILLACSNDATFTITEKNSVKYVSNSGKAWGDQTPVQLEFIQKIGDLNNSDENYNLHMPMDLEVDQDGNIYIADLGSRRIQKFNKNGEYVLTIGQEGQGPGEFQYPNCTGLVDNFLYVYDGGSFTIQKFLLNGELVSTSRTGIQKMFLEFGVIDSETFITQFSPVVVSATISEDKNRSTLLLRVLDFEGNEKSAFGEVIDYGSFELNSMLNQVVYTIDKVGSVYAIYNALNRIEKYDKTGKLLFQSTRFLDFESNDSPKSMEEITFISRSAGMDNEGRLWVSTMNKIGHETNLKNMELQKQRKEPDFTNLDKSFKLEIFSKDGILLGEIDQPSFGNIRIFNDRLYIIDDNLTMSVSVYNIVTN